MFLETAGTSPGLYMYRCMAKSRRFTKTVATSRWTCVPYGLLDFHFSSSDLVTLSGPMVLAVDEEVCSIPRHHDRAPSGLLGGYSSYLLWEGASPREQTRGHESSVLAPCRPKKNVLDSSRQSFLLLTRGTLMRPWFVRIPISDRYRNFWSC